MSRAGFKWALTPFNKRPAFVFYVHAPQHFWAPPDGIFSFVLINQPALAKQMAARANARNAHVLFESIMAISSVLHEVRESRSSKKVQTILLIMNPCTCLSAPVGRRPSLAAYVTRMGPTDGATVTGGHGPQGNLGHFPDSTPFPHPFPLNSHALTSVEGRLGQDGIGAAVRALNPVAAMRSPLAVGGWPSRFLPRPVLSKDI